MNLFEYLCNLAVNPVNDIDHIGKHIREKRLKSKLSQKELGELLGITQQQVSRYETGLDRPCKSEFKLILSDFLLKNEKNMQKMKIIYEKSYFWSKLERKVSYPTSERIYKQHGELKKVVEKAKY